ncbi:MAG: carboxypeptidase regulatory-like domain-containing protein [Verrucomicrobia bacterium]|nr:carboxypeptidase regulatory-like domain-containing protein [Verrucomicrobiota bacterium]
MEHFSSTWKRIGCVLLLTANLVTAAAASTALEIGPNTTDQLPRGKEADGIIGDFLLRNDLVEAVISGNLPLRRANMSTFYGTNGMTPGCLYDLTLRGAHNDQITIFSPSGQMGAVSYVRIANDGRDGDAVVEAVLTGPSNSGLFKRHEYRLRDGWQGILVTTTWRNETHKAIKVTTPDRWTNFARTNSLADIRWADAVDPADKAGYAFAAVENPPPADTVELQPGQTLQYARFLAVGTSPAEAVGIVATRLGKTGLLGGRVHDKDGRAVPTAAILIRTNSASTATNCVAYPDRQGMFEFRLPVAEYLLEFTDSGRAAVKQTLAASADQPQRLDIVMERLAVVEFDIRDEAGRSLPCKAQFHGIEGTPSPHLGPPNRAHGCVDQYHSETGRFRVPLPAGKYKVIVTRGIEYSHLERPVELRPEESARVEGILKRLVDTTGWVSADYHNHSTPSGDNTCGTDDRIINLAAEHIEFAPTTEHNRLYDWRPHIQKLGLIDFLQTVPGIELTGSGPHLNSFPFKPEPFKQDNGAPVWNRDPRISAITLRDWQGAEPDRWIQINHPDMVENFIDRDADGQVDGGFQGIAQLIDGLETQNYATSEILDGRPFRIGKDSAGKEVVFYIREFTWLQMLNRGHRYAAMAVNDAHSVYGNGVGSWRMYMPSKSDHPPEIDWRENSRHAKAGRSILTTGPFLQVRTEEGSLPGSTVRGPGGVRLHVKVQCTDWIDIDRVQVLVNGRARRDLNFTRKTHADWFGSGVVKFERDLQVPLAEDAHVIVVAVGENFDLSIGYGTSTQSRIKPFAYHNPIFVDVDGSGFTPNGDLLGWALPVKKLTVDQVRKMTPP